MDASQVGPPDGTPGHGILLDPDNYAKDYPAPHAPAVRKSASACAMGIKTVGVSVLLFPLSTLSADPREPAPMTRGFGGTLRPYRIAGFHRLTYHRLIPALGVSQFCCRQSQNMLQGVMYIVKLWVSQFRFLLIFHEPTQSHQGGNVFSASEAKLC